MAGKATMHDRPWAEQDRPMTDEERWKQDGERYGWKLPPPARWFWRLPVVRRVRYAWLMCKVDRHNAMWGSFGSIPTGYDSWVLYAIARGWC